MNELERSYVNGSDILLKAAGKCVASCTTHKTTFGTETKDRSVKPVASASKSAGLFKGKGVTGLNISISAEGLRANNETENGFVALSAEWGKGKHVEVECFERENDANPYIKGWFVITSIEETSPAQDDVTYSISLENDGEPEVYPGKVTAE